MQMAGGPQISVDGPVISTAGPVISKTDTALCCCASRQVLIDCRSCQLPTTIPVLFQNVHFCNGPLNCLRVSGNLCADFITDMDYLETFAEDEDDPPTCIVCRWSGKTPVPSGECRDNWAAVGYSDDDLFYWATLDVEMCVNNDPFFSLTGTSPVGQIGGGPIHQATFFSATSTETSCSGKTRVYTNLLGTLCLSGDIPGGGGQATF